jgi:hypothetical protein
MYATRLFKRSVDTAASPPSPTRRAVDPCGSSTNERSRSSLLCSAFSLKPNKPLRIGSMRISRVSLMPKPCSALILLRCVSTVVVIRLGHLSIMRATACLLRPSSLMKKSALSCNRARGMVCTVGKRCSSNDSSSPAAMPNSSYIEWNVSCICSTLAISSSSCLCCS